MTDVTAADVDQRWDTVDLRPRERASTRWWAALCSALVPGTGQLLRRHWWRAGVLLAWSTAVVGVLVWAAVQPASMLVARALDPDVLTGLVVANVVGLLVRALATFDALRDPRRPRTGSAWRRAGATLGILGLVVLLVAPHAAAGWSLHRTQTVVDRVFVTTPIERPAPPPADEQDPGGPNEQVDGALHVPDLDHSPLDGLDDLGELDGLDRLDRSPPGGDSPVGGPDNPWIARGRLTVAVLGSDHAPGRFSARTDAMLVVSIDTVTGDAAILSVDRYLRDFPVPSRFADLYEQRCATGGSWDYLNALYTCASARAPEQFGARYPEAADPAAAAVTETLSLLLGLEIDHHAIVDMAGFVGMVDGLGGVDVDVAERIVVRISPSDGVSPWRTHQIPSGRQRLDGEEALAFVRMRDPGDAGRMRRQRCLVSSLVRNTDVAGVVRGFSEITRAIEEHVVTDVPVGALPDLLQVLTRVEGERLVGVGLGPPTYRGEDHTPNLAAIRGRVAQVLEDPLGAVESSRSTETGVETCG